ncbi:hypothetical protein, partial [uncultured Desulfovibrio sp.]|uniref:hypothetical protein n=1 Tax=uncultured Desulfovibrio sp. TaxID=167968 RepID=UPI00261581FD
QTPHVRCRSSGDHRSGGSIAYKLSRTQCLILQTFFPKPPIPSPARFFQKDKRRMSAAALPAGNEVNKKRVGNRRRMSVSGPLSTPKHARMLLANSFPRYPLPIAQGGFRIHEQF